MWGLETTMETVIYNLRILYIQTYKNQEKSHKTKQETTNFILWGGEKGTQKSFSSREVIVNLQWFSVIDLSIRYESSSPLPAPVSGYQISIYG